MSKSSIIISVLIAACGWFGAYWLNHVDQDLRIIYSEHTLAATDLGHIYADLIRYRTTILRAIEADSERDFSRIRSSLPVIRTRMEAAVDRYIRASNKTTAGAKIDARELVELKDVQAKLDAYLTSSEHTLQSVERMWKTTVPAERGRRREEAEHYAATVAGTKLIDVAVALDELLITVGQIAGEVRKDGDTTLRFMTVVIMAVSVGLGSLVLLFQGRT